MSAYRFFAILLGVSLVAAVGCSRDPNAKKKKYFDSGNRYFEKGDYSSAAIQFSNAVQVDSLYAPAHFQLAESYLKMQRFADAYRELERTLELDPRNSKALMDTGLIFMAARSYEQVDSIAKSMLDSDPNSADARLLLSELDHAQGKPDAALAELQRAIALDPEAPRFYVQLATLQAATTKKDAAEASLKKALDLDPKFIPAVQSLAGLYESRGKWGDAEKELRYAVTLEPKRVEPRNWLARFYHSQGRETEAEQVMIQAKKDLGDEGDHYRILGEYYNNVGDSDKALAEFASVSKQHPEDLTTKEDYIQLLLSHGKAEEANTLDAAILKDIPNDSRAQILPGTILNSQGKFGDAAGILGKALKNAPENALVHNHFALLLH